MELQHSQYKKTTLNPLWIISIFFSFTETMLGYAVFNTQGFVQITLAIFVVLFPTFVAIMFFRIVWFRPKHLYAPTDYRNDQSFLDSFKETTTADNLSKQIEDTVNESLSSDKILQDLKGGENAKDVLKKTAEIIVNKIKQDNFITIDISKFSKKETKVLTFAYDDFEDFNDFSNQVFFKLRKVCKIKYFTYNYDWELVDSETRHVIVGTRMLTGTPPGDFCDDKRTLEEVGIRRGAKLVVEKPHFT